MRERFRFSTDIRLHFNLARGGTCGDRRQKCVTWSDKGANSLRFIATFPKAQQL